MKILFFYHFVKRLTDDGARHRKGAARNRRQAAAHNGNHIRRLATTLPSSLRMLISPSS